jgi:8-oxo-dGTP pyrophosphatase MutT (NUDIX family)
MTSDHQPAPENLPTVRDQAEQWPVLDSAERFAGGAYSVRSDRVRMADGNVATRDVIVHPGAVGAIGYDTATDEVLLIRQYRHPVGYQLWEPPAGLLDKPGEHPVHAARRELREETGFQADDWRTLVDLATSPGGSSEAVRVFLATGLSMADEGDGADRFVREHEEATLRLAWVPRAELVRQVLAGELHNSLLVAGLLALTVALGTPEGVAALRPADAPWPMRPFDAL